MKQKIRVKKERETLSFVSGITYATVPAWFGVTFMDLKMDIILPKRREVGAPRPVIVWLCGGAFAVMDKSIWMPELMELARRGYVVVSTMYRTSNEGIFPMALMDVKAAIRFLKAHADEFAIDPKRICAAGESAGASLAALLGVTGGMQEFEKGEYRQYDSSVNAVVDFYGLIDMKLALCTPNNSLPTWIFEAYLGADYKEENVRRASAVNYVNENTPPFLIFHGDADTTVPIRQSDVIYEALNAAGVRVDYYVLEGAIHGDDRFYQKESMELVGDFLDQVFVNIKK